MTCESGFCLDCNRPFSSIYDLWCMECNAKWFQRNFPKWTSGNEFINKFIQKTQLNAQNGRHVLEWIPYDRLLNIKEFDKGGYSIVYKANWLNRSILGWSNSGERLMRMRNQQVALKRLKNSKNLSKEFLDEV